MSRWKRVVAKVTAVSRFLWLFAAFGGLLQPVHAHDKEQRNAPPQLVLHVGHASGISAIEFAHRKRVVAAGSGDGVIKLWDLSTGLELLSIPAHRGAVQGLAMFPDDERLASASYDGTIQIWSLAQARSIATLHMNEPVWRLALSNDGRWIAAASESGKVMVWETTSLQKVLQLQDVEALTDLAFTPGGSLRAINQSYDPSTHHAEIEWALPSGRVVRESRGTTPIALSKDGTNLLATARTSDGQHEVVTLSDAAGIKLATWKFSTESEEIVDADLSPDGKAVVINSMMHQDAATDFTWVRVRNSSTGRVLHTLVGRNENATVNSLVKFSPDGKTIAVSANNDISFFDASTGGRSGQIAWAARPETVEFSPSEHWLAVVLRRTLKVWDLTTGALAMNLGPVDVGARVAFSPDDRYVASWSFDPATLNTRAAEKLYYVKIWDLQNGGEVHTPSEGGPINDIVFSPDGKQLAYSINASVVLCEPASGKVLHRLHEELDYMTHHWLSFNADGSRLLDFSSNYDFHLWDAEHGELVKKWNEPNPPQSSAEGVGDRAGTQMFAHLDYDHIIRLWSRRKLTSVRVSANKFSVDALAFAPDAFTLAVGSFTDRQLVFYGAPDLRERQRITMQSEVGALGYSPNGKWLAIGLMNGETTLYDTATWKLAATLVAMGSTSDWMIMTPEGAFDGSERGLHTLMAWRFGDKQYPMDRFFQDFYAPRLLPRILNGETPKPALSLEALGFPPAVQIVSHTILNSGQQARIEVHAVDQGGGLKELRLYQNGKLIATRAADVGRSKIDAEFIITLAHGENRFDATALNGRDVESNEDVLRVQQAASAQKPVLHVVTIGISQYEDATLNLDYPRADSNAVAEAFRRGGADLFSHVDVIHIADGEATADGIRKALSTLHAAADDVVVVYFAGHGKLLQDQFYLLAYDADIRLVPTTTETIRGGISAQELGSILLGVAATRQLVIIDSCESGSAVQQIETAIKAAKAEQALSHNIGIHVLAATGATQREKEIPGLGHSTLTAAVLEAIGATGVSKAPANPDGTITVESIISFAKLRNSQLARQLNAIDSDSMSGDSGLDFPIVRSH